MISRFPSRLAELYTLYRPQTHAHEHEEFSEQVTRPGFGRGVPTFPESIDVGAERIVRVGFPRLAVDAQILDAMEAFEVAVP